MNDFKKGLLVGMLIIIGCGTFIASSSNDDVGRYTMVKTDSSSRIYLLDTKTANLYISSFDGSNWEKRQWFE